MLWVPKKGPLRVETNGGTPASPGTTVTTGAGTSATKGSVAQLIASTSFDAYLLAICVSDYCASNLASEACLDIMIGAATEEIIIADLLVGYAGQSAAGAFTGARSYLFPIYIPAGTRISAKACGALLSTAMRVSIHLYGGDGYPPFRVGSKVITYGVTAPNGTVITPGATNAEGGHAQITATTSDDHFALVHAFQLQGDISTNNRMYMVDVGIGAATEEVIYSDYQYHTSVNESICGPFPLPMPIFQDIPSGTRLTMRASCSGTVDGPFGGALYGLT